MDSREDADDIVCLDESFFINDNYQLTTFTFGSHVLQLYCLQAASKYFGLTTCETADFDLTGQLVWPGAELLNDYLSENADMLQGCSAIELGSGVGITGILCSRYCHKVILTDHNEEVLKILKKNIDLCASTQSSSFCAGLTSQKLEWGNADQINNILQENPKGFDLVLGADICFQQSSIPLLFDTAEQLLVHGGAKCKFILAYVSRAKVMDVLVVSEAVRHGLLINEVAGTRKMVRNLEGVIYEISLA